MGKGVMGEIIRNKAGGRRKGGARGVQAVDSATMLPMRGSGAGGGKGTEQAGKKAQNRLRLDEDGGALRTGAPQPRTVANVD